MFFVFFEGGRFFVLSLDIQSLSSSHAEREDVGVSLEPLKSAFSSGDVFFTDPHVRYSPGCLGRGFDRFSPKWLDEFSKGSGVLPKCLKNSGIVIILPQKLTNVP